MGGARQRRNGETVEVILWPREKKTFHGHRPQVAHRLTIDPVLHVCWLTPEHGRSRTSTEGAQLLGFSASEVYLVMVITGEGDRIKAYIFSITF